MSGAGDFGATAKRALNSYVAYNLVNYALGFAFQILMVKTLSATEYATYMLLLAVLLTAESLLSLGVDRTIKRFAPVLAHDHDWNGMRALGRRLAIVRAGTLVFFLGALVIGRDLLGQLLPEGMSTELLIAFGVWFLGARLFDDMDSLAQGLVEHGMSVVMSTAELVLRIVAVLALFVLTPVATAAAVVTICAATIILVDIVLVFRLKRRLSELMSTVRPTGQPGAGAGETLARVPGFMAAAYGSTLGWMISNPSVVRIVASTGLQVTVLAAFSFLQALTGALQRLFPGLLLLPVLEPILAGMSVRGRQGHALGALSFIFKLDLAIALSATLAIALAGHDIVTLLSQPAYAEHYAILFVLFGSIFLSTIYRIFEIQAALVFKQRIFLLLWPIGLVSVGLIYLTVDSWGLAAVLLWPFLENLARILILLVVFRNDGIWRTLDPASSLMLAGAALVAGGAMLGLAWLVDVPAGIARIGLAVAAVLIFAASWFVIRPFRRTEIDLVARMLPSSWGRLRTIAMGVARRPNSAGEN